MKKKKKILIVDDERDFIALVRAILDAGGYDISQAHDGQEGLERARAENPDLVILDLMLPKMNGYEVCRMLKFDEKYKKIPIIIFSARSRDVDRDMAEEAGADAYLRKDFKPQALLDKVGSLI